ncbi:MAG: hypothetical protein IPK83_21555 [Planctomycetes bacterium]|nr:hypothetical protein [Planctomycetota bacterium]
MFESKRILSSGKAAILSLFAVAMVPFTTGCLVAALPAVAFGSVLWLDLALTPIRSLLGGLALDVVNTL